MNIIEEVQKLTGNAPIEKVDPNTQTPPAEMNDNSAELLSQAAIPVALIGLYKYTRNEDFAANLVGAGKSANTKWTTELFGDKAEDVLSQVATYAHVGNSRAQSAIDEAAAGAVTVANNDGGNYVTGNSIATFFKDQRSDILKHLPPALQIGYLLDDNTIDDRTHKMEGPVSGLMHSIEKIFSDSDANDSTKQ